MILPARRPNQPLKFDKMAISFMVIATVSLVLTWWQQFAGASIHFDRSRIDQGEWWRFLSAHLVHAGKLHWLANMAAFAAILFIYRDILKFKALAAVCVSLIMGLSIALYFLTPSLIWYLGFSGVLHGLFAFGAVSSLQQKKSGHVIALGFVLFKIVYERWQGSDRQFMGMPVAVDAHLYGVAIGIILAFIPCIIPHKMASNKSTKPSGVRQEA